jgi:hypothetical protein
MYRALVFTIFAGLITPAHAHQKNTPPSIKAEAATQVTMQKSGEAIKVSASRALPVAAVEDSAPLPEGGWGKYGTLLATLVVMCAIALRRQRLGRS